MDSFIYYISHESNRSLVDLIVLLLLAFALMVIHKAITTTKRKEIANHFSAIAKIFFIGVLLTLAVEGISYIACAIGGLIAVVLAYLPEISVWTRRKIRVILSREPR